MVEHFLDVEVVVGSIPSPPTMENLQKLLCERMREYYGKFGIVQAIGIAGDDEYHAYFEKFFPHVKKKDIPTTFENNIVNVIKVGKIRPAKIRG